MLGMTKEIVDIKDDWNETALMKAAREGHVKIMKLLLDHGADVGVRSSFWGRYQAIHYATSSGHLDVAKLIAGKHPEVLKARSSWGAPLDIAREWKHNNIVRWLQTEKGVTE